MTGTIFYIYSFRYWPLALLAAELGVVIYLSARIEKMSVGMARSLFFLYAALNGIVFSAYLFAFSLEILWMVFGITSLFFGIMALIGWFGNINFTKLRPFMLGGLVFLFFYWIFAMFIDLSAFDTIVSTVGIFLFLVLTAYDVKKIQAFHAYYGQAPEMAAKASIFFRTAALSGFYQPLCVYYEDSGAQEVSRIPGIYLMEYYDYPRGVLT